MATTRSQAPSEHQSAMEEAASIAAALTRAENSPARAIVLSSKPALTRDAAFAAFDGTADSFTEGCAIAEVPMALNGPDLTMGIDGHQLTSSPPLRTGIPKYRG